MGHRIVDTTLLSDSYYLLTQTPGNKDKSNYWLKELQDKVNADWNTRPNRASIEQETENGSEEYFPLEVVLQSVRDDKGTKVSDDWRRIVFKDISYKVAVGQRWRFPIRMNEPLTDENANIWIGVNQDSVSPTAQQVVVRCNGTLGSIYTDENGVAQYHYEPVSQKETLSAATLSFNQVAVDPRSTLTIIAQHNKYTQNYYINQRFIIGYDQVYKVKNIIKTGALSTFNPQDVGIITLYLDLDQVSGQDDFATRIAFNGEENSIVNPPANIEEEIGYSLQISEPNPLPTNLLKAPIEFKAGLYKNNTLTDTPISVEAFIENSNNSSDYFDLRIVDNNTFTLSRKKYYFGNISVKCFIPADISPLGVEISQTFEMFMGGV